MNLLIVEDYWEMRERIVELINETYPDVNVVAVESYGELRTKLLTQVFDAAIVDIDLSKWPDFLDKDETIFDKEARIENGHGLAVLIRQLNNTIDNNKVVLYTANNKAEKINDPSFFVFEKKFDLDFIKKFRKEVLEKVIQIEEIRPIPSIEQFRLFTPNQKIKYYKDYLSIVNTKERFECLGDLSWASNIQNTHNKLCVGPALEEKVQLNSQFEFSGYEELGKLINAVSTIPNIMWNFRMPNFFQKQSQNIGSFRRLDSTLRLFYNIAFSANLASYLISIKEQEIFENYLSVLEEQGSFCYVETQNCIIRNMSLNGEKPSAINDVIRRISSKIGLEVVDLFDCTLVEFDKSNNMAWVILKSFIDPNRNFKKKFKYNRLELEGVKYKEDNFFYCVTRDGRNTGGFVEPN